MTFLENLTFTEHLQLQVIKIKPVHLMQPDLDAIILPSEGSRAPAWHRVLFDQPNPLAFP